MAPAPGTRGYTKAIVAAQMLAQIGAFVRPAEIAITPMPMRSINRQGDAITQVGVELDPAPKHPWRSWLRLLYWRLG
jgi:hypothetical protein